MLRSWVRWAIVSAALAVGLLITAGPSYATTAPPSQVGAVTVSHRVVFGDISWKLAARYCGSGRLYESMTVVSTVASAGPRVPPGTVRDLARIWPGDLATIPCARYGRSVDRPAAKPVTPPAALWVHPLPGARCSSPYGPRWGTVHRGADLVRPAGTPVRAARAGTVIRAGWWSRGYGISVLVSHGGGLYTHYAHLSRAAVRVGQRVGSGQMLGREGSTGYSFGAHLHFEIWAGWWRQVNPTPYLRAHGVRLGCAR